MWKQAALIVLPRHTALPLLQRNEQAYCEKLVKWRVSKSDLKHLKKIFYLLLLFIQFTITITITITIVHHLHSACEITLNGFRVALRPCVSHGIRIRITTEFQGRFKQILQVGLQLYALRGLYLLLTLNSSSLKG